MRFASLVTSIGTACLISGLISCLVSCSGKTPLPKGPIKLVEVAGARVERTLEKAGTSEILLVEDFAGGTDSWRSMAEVKEMLRPAGEELSISTGEPDAPMLRLGGQRGALWRILEVEAGSYLEFTGRTRSRDLVPTTETNFFGGTLWIALLDARGEPEEILAGGLEAIALEIHQLPTGRGTTDWIEHRRVIRTPPGTRSVLLGCVLSVPVPLESGEVDFTDLQVRRVDRRSHLEDLARIAVAERSPGNPLPEDWRGERLVRGTLRGEARPALLGMPGEAISFHLSLPGESPRLEVGLGAWTEALDGAGDEDLVFTVTVEGVELLRETMPLPARYLDAHWRDVELDLARWAGEEVELTFQVVGGLPGIWGAPIVRDVAPDSDRDPAKKNILLVSIDTLRADHVHSYGYWRPTTPRLDQLATRGVRFTDCTVQSPYTLPSHVSIFSGQCPSVHGVQEAGRAISAARTPMLARILSQRGWTTRAFTAGGFVSPVFGFAEGFDGYSNIDPLRDDSSPHFQALLSQQPETISADLVREYGPERVKEWITDHADEPFFLFLHTYAVHDFDPPPGYLDRFADPDTSDLKDFMPYMDWRYITEHGISDEDLAHIVRHYDAALLYVDEVIGEVLDHLETQGLRENTIVVVTSDHGKELVERGIIGHGVTLYEEMVRVPLIIDRPGGEPGVVNRPVMSIDIAPTLLGLLGLPIDPRMQGVDLFADSIPERTIWSEVVDPLAHKYCLREQGWKLIHDPEEREVLFPSPGPWELFSLSDDPEEKANLFEAEPRAAERLSESLLRLRGRYEELGASLGHAGEGELDEETLVQLRALGYL
jgi:arylsulfatase A-like enzyme